MRAELPTTGFLEAARRLPNSFDVEDFLECVLHGYRVALAAEEAFLVEWWWTEAFDRTLPGIEHRGEWIPNPGEPLAMSRDFAIRARRAAPRARIPGTTSDAARRIMRTTFVDAGFDELRGRVEKIHKRTTIHFEIAEAMGTFADALGAATKGLRELSAAIVAAFDEAIEAVRTGEASLELAVVEEAARVYLEATAGAKVLEIDLREASASRDVAVFDITYESAGGPRRVKIPISEIEAIVNGTSALLTPPPTPAWKRSLGLDS